KMLSSEDVLPKEREMFLGMALRNAERLNSTLNELLDLSKLVSGRLVCRFQEVPLKNLLLPILDKFCDRANAAGYELTLSIERDLPVILGDAFRLEQVFRSICENALKFGSPGGKLNVKLAVERVGKVVFECTNPTTSNITAKELRDIFTIFSQREAVLDRVHEGVGGSLAIAAETIAQHEGVLNAELANGQFAVRVELPVLDNERALLKVLESRIYALRTELGATSLLILEVPVKSFQAVVSTLRSALFRASDAVYTLPRAGQIAVVMDDCKKSDAPKIVSRLFAEMNREAAKFLTNARAGLASFPEDSTDPEELLVLSRQRLEKVK
ncbi:MAG TPA: ATP-binding protein, partial [Oligoflexia bacterium]|nr:ATP-binding protein [Oligoflexia bacterium]